MTKEVNATIIAASKRVSQSGKRDEDLDRMLSEIGSGYKVQIRRLTPSWCDGLLETCEHDPDLPISSEDIADRWGGRKLQIKVFNSNGDYAASKVLSFAEPPKKEGRELIQGPDGMPRYKHEELVSQETVIAQPQPVQNELQTSLLQSLIQAQAQQNQNMQNMLVQRVNHLEGLLEHRAEQTPQQTNSEAKPFDGLKDTIKMIQEMENLRAVIGSAQGAPVAESESSPWNSAIEKMLEFWLERERHNMQIKQAQELQRQQFTPPPLPAAPSAPMLPGDSNNSTDLQLINTLQKRLSETDNATKATLIQAVLGEDLDDVLNLIPEEREDNEETSDNAACDDSYGEVHSSLLSAQDRAELEEDDEAPEIGTAAQGERNQTTD